MGDTKLITQGGYNKLKTELDHLKNVERPLISEAVGTAREMGDLKENAEYHTGKERQAQIEGRIQFLEQILIDSEIFDVNNIKSKQVVMFSASVEIEDLETESKRVIKLVGEHESDIRNNMISVVSPLGISLLNKKVGDIAICEAPSGTKEYEIISISY